MQSADNGRRRRIRPTRRFVDDYLPALLAQASHLISSEFHRVARQHGFSVSEWRVLASLAGGEPISIGRLAQVTVTKQPTVTRLLDRMEAKGQVERLPHDSDRRVTLVRITRKGAQTVEHLMELAREHERGARALRPGKRAEELKDTLRQMIELHARGRRGTSAADDDATRRPGKPDHGSLEKIAHRGRELLRQLVRQRHHAPSMSRCGPARQGAPFPAACGAANGSSVALDDQRRLRDRADAHPPCDRTRPRDGRSSTSPLAFNASSTKASSRSGRPRRIEGLRACARAPPDGCRRSLGSTASIGGTLRARRRKASSVKGVDDSTSARTRADMTRPPVPTAMTPPVWWPTT